MKFRNPETGEVFGSNVTIRGPVTELEVVEDSMDKPRICEALGVEVGESFRIRGFDKVEFWIMDDGTFSTRPSNVAGSTMALLRTLDHTDRIIRKPCWTEREVECAKYTKRILSVDAVRRHGYGGGLVAFTNDGSVVIAINRDLFPSLRPGQTVKLEEIIGNTHDEEGGQ